MKRITCKLIAMVLSLSLLVPFTSYAGQWVQDNVGWKVQNDDGSYITNSWYQSPESGLFYYMGADGYMLTSTTTPDGYTVNADGVWTQSDSASSTSTNNDSGGIDTSGWDLGGGSVTVETGGSDQSLSPEQNAAINNSTWN